MKHIKLLSVLLLLSQAVSAASLQNLVNLRKFGIHPANYSGLTPFGNNLYAVVSDKEALDGFYVWEIQQDPTTGQITYVNNRGYQGQVPLDTNQQGISLRDAEDIVYCPQRSSFFVCGEGYQDIIELNREGQRTGYELSVPDYLRAIYPNYGFEALAYDSVSRTFFTTTENVLPADGIFTSPSNPVSGKLRLQTFRAEADGHATLPHFSPFTDFVYLLDAPRSTQLGRGVTHGVVAMTALGNGRLAVLEREAYISQIYMGSWVTNKVYIVDTNAAPGSTLQKTLLTEWRTNFALLDQSWANFEGMCLGAPLADGRQTLLFVSDSQGGYGIGPIRLQDYMRVVVI